MNEIDITPIEKIITDKGYIVKFSNSAEGYVHIEFNANTGDGYVDSKIIDEIEKEVQAMFPDSKVLCGAGIGGVLTIEPKEDSKIESNYSSNEDDRINKMLHEKGLALKHSSHQVGEQEFFEVFKRTSPFPDRTGKTFEDKNRMFIGTFEEAIDFIENYKENDSVDTLPYQLVLQSNYNPSDLSDITNLLLMWDGNQINDIIDPMVEVGVTEDDAVDIASVFSDQFSIINELLQETHGEAITKLKRDINMFLFKKLVRGEEADMDLGSPLGRGVRVLNSEKKNKKNETETVDGVVIDEIVEEIVEKAAIEENKISRKKMGEIKDYDILDWIGKSKIWKALQGYGYEIMADDNSIKVFRFIGDSGFGAGWGKGVANKEAYDWAIKNGTLIPHDGEGYEYVDFLEVRPDEYESFKDEMMAVYKDAKEDNNWTAKAKAKVDNLDLDNIFKLMQTEITASDWADEDPTNKFEEGDTVKVIAGYYKDRIGVIAEMESESSFEHWGGRGEDGDDTKYYKYLVVGESIDPFSAEAWIDEDDLALVE